MRAYFVSVLLLSGSVCAQTSTFPAYNDDLNLGSLDNARPKTLPSLATSQTVSVNLSANRHPISDEIFGVSFGDAVRNQAIGYTVRRWGGNSVTRYNWQGVEHNSASDYFFINYTPSQTDDADAFIDEARTAGAQPFITIPTIGWTPIDDRIANHWGFSVAKYGAQLETEFTATGGQSWANPDAGNGECNPMVNHTVYCVADAPGASHGLIRGNDISDTSIAAPPSFEALWVAHIQSRVGTAASGGVKYYALDNEAMLWNSTHRDVHPIPPTYDEIWQKAVDYGSAIKAQDPNAKIFGPVTWGWCDIFTDAADAARGPSCIDGIDRQAHGGVPFAQWYLQQVCDYQTAHGIRLIDYLDVHIYPQDDGVHDIAATGSNVDESATTAAWRLRSLKELYDPTYTQESWIADQPQWIPRLKSWIAASCPGTKLAITEYKWGPDNGASGALAQAEALAIFAREGVDLAARWVAPDVGSYAEDAFTLYLNYDGTHTRVSGDSVAATSSDVDALGAYAMHRVGHYVYVLLFNKSTSSQDVTVTLSSALAGAWRWYRFDGTHHLAMVSSGTIAGTGVSLNAIPARSSNLLVLPDSNFLFVNGFE